MFLHFTWLGFVTRFWISRIPNLNIYCYLKQILDLFMKNKKQRIRQQTELSYNVTTWSYLDYTLINLIDLSLGRLAWTGWFLHESEMYFRMKKTFLNGILSKHPVPAKGDEFPHIISMAVISVIGTSFVWIKFHNLISCQPKVVNFMSQSSNSIDLLIVYDGGVI